MSVCLNGLEVAGGVEWRWRREMGGVGRSRESESEKINGCRRGGSTWLKAWRRRGWRASLRVI